jgi:hypothetical protein
LDPDNPQTYTVTAFYLRERMNRVAEADAVLHEGLRNCPGSYDILFELGRLDYESYHDRDRARNVWEEAARQWLELDPATPKGKQPAPKLVADWLNRPLSLVQTQKDNQLVMEQITTHLAMVEEEENHPLLAIEWLLAAQRVSETPGILSKQIEELKTKLGHPAE